MKSMMGTDATHEFRWYRPILTAVVVLVLALTGGRASCWASPAAAAAPRGAEPAGQPTPPASPATSAAAPGASASVGQTYASREANAKSLQNFQGGDIVIIGSGGLVLVLVILLILVLI
jgi:hypothetical protein